MPDNSQIYVKKVAYLYPRTEWKQNGRWKHLSNSQQLVDVSFLMLDAPSCLSRTAKPLISNRVDVRQGKISRPCTVVWQLFFLLLEIVGGRLCPVEQVMTCGGKKQNTQTATAAIEETFKRFPLFEHHKFVVTCRAMVMG